MRRSLALVICAACASAPKAVTVPAASATSHPAAAALPSLPSCTLAVGPPREFEIPARLAAIAPQYFHPQARDAGFNDLVPGTRRYVWYDPSALDVAVNPPGDMAIIVRSTKSFFFGWAEDGSLRVARRTDTKAKPLGTLGLDVLDVAETSGGQAWLLAAPIDSGIIGRELHVFHVTASLAMTEWVLHAATQDDPWDRRIVVTPSSRVGVAWVAAAPDGLDVVASWLGSKDFGPPAPIDHVTIDRDAATLSLRSSTSLRLAPDGRDRVAFAWRPIVPAEGERVDLGSRSSPPSRGATAEVRIGTIDAAGASKRNVHPARADVLGFTTGIGPWPLRGNGMVSASLGGHAIFFWIDGSRGVLMATPDDATPRRIASGAPRLLPRVSPSGLELLLLESAGPQSLVPIGCR